MTVNVGITFSLSTDIYSPAPPPMASILSVQLEEPHTVTVTSSVVAVSILELWISPSISKTQMCAKVVTPKTQKIKLGLILDSIRDSVEIKVLKI